MREQYIRQGDGILMVYAVTNRRTFSTIPALHKSILRTFDATSFPIVLVGNHSDCTATDREVTAEGKIYYFFGGGWWW